MEIEARFAPPRRHGSRREFTVHYADDRLQIATLDGGWISVTRSQWSALVERVERLLDVPTPSPVPAESGWSPDDDDLLQSMWTAGSSMDAMIDGLDRNSLQIERRLFRLGIIVSRRALQGR
ncbi:hypothetical protein GCM10011529_12350 [Polymorphobacter glacialis]|uniref:Uncharacterized protein n=1 Tax=Sandarakinorhabdus glacialis TaxID=1614636 RepID=A0A916ZPA4_9SPHN|nr:hypothetical protein [Polymorphobacter glacialis]GGE07481.1 hypothetical protein GCM10011529_12350 [Polymorphobacter glacialis]